jgi:hypothetical protein
LIIGLFSATAFFGVAIFPFLTWKYKRILDRRITYLLRRIEKKATNYYFNIFLRPISQDQTNQNSMGSNENSGTNNNKEELKESFYKIYGGGIYINPAIFITILLCIAFVFIGGKLLPLNQSSLNETDRILISAILGGYIWVLFDFIDRRYREDLTPTALYWMSFRILAALPIGFLLAKTFGNQESKLLIAFFAGTFPAYTLRRYGRRYFLKKTQFQETESKVGDLRKIQGIDQTIFERLEEEGIRTIQQLAYVDPVKLLLKSNFRYAFIMDWINQAFLYLYFEDGVKKLRSIGIRTALELTHIEKDQNLIKLTADKLEMDPSFIKSIIAKMNENVHIRQMRCIGSSASEKNRSLRWTFLTKQAFWGKICCFLRAELHCR